MFIFLYLTMPLPPSLGMALSSFTHNMQRPGQWMHWTRKAGLEKNVSEYVIDNVHTAYNAPTVCLSPTGPVCSSAADCPTPITASLHLKVSGTGQSLSWLQWLVSEHRFHDSMRGQGSVLPVFSGTEAESV